MNADQKINQENTKEREREKSAISLFRVFVIQMPFETAKNAKYAKRVPRLPFAFFACSAVFIPIDAWFYPSVA